MQPPLVAAGSNPAPDGGLDADVEVTHPHEVRFREGTDDAFGDVHEQICSLAPVAESDTEDDCSVGVDVECGAQLPPGSGPRGGGAVPVGLVQTLGTDADFTPRLRETLETSPHGVVREDHDVRVPGCLHRRLLQFHRPHYAGQLVYQRHRLHPCRLEDRRQSAGDRCVQNGGRYAFLAKPLGQPGGGRHRIGCVPEAMDVNGHRKLKESERESVQVCFLKKQKTKPGERPSADGGFRAGRRCWSCRAGVPSRNGTA